MENKERTTEQMQFRSIPAELQTRDAQTADESPRIEGYFAVFGDIYDMGFGLTESIAPGAFDETLSGDIRALINHDTTLVLGRTSAHTLDLRADEHGLWGSIDVNTNDTDAMNLYSRVQRGDVSQCSIGFEILDESTEFHEDGSIHWTINKIKLYEVSPCTFPAYESTSISARQKDAEAIRARQLEAWKSGMKNRLKGGHE